MNSVTVHGGCELGAAARSYLHECLEGIAARHAILHDPELVVSRTGHDYLVTITGHLLKHGHCEAHGESENLNDAVNIAVERFDSRLRKQEDKLHDHHHTPIKDLA